MTAQAGGQREKVLAPRWFQPWRRGSYRGQVIYAGTDEIVVTCDHLHRTPEGAMRCARVQLQDFTGWRSS